MDLKAQLPVIIRYIIATAAAALATHGWLSPEQNAVIGQNIDVVAGAFVALGTVAYALFRRPSSKALEVAKQVDAKVPKDGSVVVKTPGGMADIVVHPK